MAGVPLRRLDPPRLDRGQVLRPRLIERLSGRWDRRATVIVAGPGFGKSTLLAQAMAENRLAPRGYDHFISLTEADNDRRTLLSAITTSLIRAADGPESDRPAESSPTLDTAVDLATGMPPGTCLIFDDVHVLDPESEGHDLLSAFVRQLPLQCSLVLASRTRPSMEMPEWHAKGLIEVIDELSMCLTEAEIATIETTRGVRIDGRVGVWPALAELAAASHANGTDAFLTDVVLRSYTTNQQRWIAALLFIGGGDRALVSAALDEPITAEQFEVIDRFPMMQNVAGGGIRPHALWEPVLTKVFTDTELTALRGRAAAALLGRDQHADAFRLFAALQNWDGAASVIADVCKRGYNVVPHGLLREWRDAFPADQQDRAEVLLIRGILGREQHTFTHHTTSLLRRAVDDFRGRGLVGAEVAALAEIAFVAREQGILDIALQSTMRLYEIGSLGGGEAIGLQRFGEAIMAEALDDDAATISAIDQIEPNSLSRQWYSRAVWLRGHSFTMMGRPELGLPFAEQSWELAEDDFLGARYLQAYIRWWIAPSQAAVAALPFLGDEEDPSPFDHVYGGSVLGTVFAYLGDIERAAATIAIATGSAFNPQNDCGPRDEYLGLLACARAAVLVAQGDDTTAAEVIRPFFADHSPDTPLGRRTIRRWHGLVSVLLPELRAAIDSSQYGVSMAEAKAASDWFVRLRAECKDSAPKNVSAHILNGLPLRWAVEAAARYATFEPENARALTEQLVTACGPRVRDLLREMLGESKGVAEGAKRLLGAVPIAPAQPLRISVVGALDVDHGGVASASPELRRERVRQIIIALAVHGPLHREQLATMFWPDLDKTATSQNLRTTLNYVHKVFEPDRGAGDAPFVLRQVGDMLSLAGSPWVEVDLVQINALADAAESHRKSGAHSAELLSLEQICAAVRGQPLLDVQYEDWAETIVTATRATVVSAMRRAAEMRFAMGDHRAAQSHATKCITLDEWNQSANRVLVASLLADGDESGARRAFDRWHRTMLDVGLTPSPEMDMLSRRLGMTITR